MTDPGWNPDPAGRHELRYWDGAAWTDNVSDAGVAATDALTAVEPAQPALPTQPTQAAPPPAATPTPQPAAPPFATATAAPAKSGGSKKTPLIVGGIVAVVAIAAGAFFLLGGDDDGRDVATARAGLENILDDNDAPTDVLDDAIDIGDCPFDFLGPVSDPISDADSDATDIDPDTNLVVVFFPPDEPALTCGVFVEDGGDGYFVDIYIASMGAGLGAQDLVDEYNELSDDTDIDIELADLGKAEGGEMLRACADQFVLPGDDPEEFFEDPYCDTVWVSDGLVIGIEQFQSQSLKEDDAKAMVLLFLDEVLATLEAEA